ncbi:hypothetical protein SKAU_G00363660 [Synaphobranchus kaupii]|uniref:Uncharacterized protein n=1 Tax=Synaphobranchus kaupii TaxID=118154 RepID=A0A9Q1EIW1_SYNKA|nr:hypothetical protein SKAU_G00363660 [Synaphobranchus kaupii]
MRQQTQGAPPGQLPRVSRGASCIMHSCRLRSASAAHATGASWRIRGLPPRAGWRLWRIQYRTASAKSGDDHTV